MTKTRSYTLKIGFYICQRSERMLFLIELHVSICQYIHMITFP